MIDIHSHILPGVDDGAQSLEEALELAKAAVDEGIHTIIATPHHANGKYSNEAEPVKLAVRQLNGILQQQGITLEVRTGQEIRVYSNLIDDYFDQRLLTLDQSRYILLEFPSGSIPRDIENLFHELKVSGLVPVIAHPERNAEISAHPERLTALIQAGALAQITSHSINGAFGPKIQQLSMKLCRQNLIHIVASDVHNMTHRAFGLRQAYDRIASELGEEVAEYYQTNASCIRGNLQIEVREPVADRRKWYQFW